jgi:hypothetical protein
MRNRFLTIALLLMVTSIISAQFVGDGATKPETTNASKAGKSTFTIKFGAAMPLSLYGTTPDRTSVPQYSAGVMGAKTGFFVEAGMGLNLNKPGNKVGFYYFPILASYWQTPLDWSSLGGFFSNKDIYTKPMNIMDIAQRYGIVVKPVDNLSLALYYRPGLIIPFKYEISHESVSDGESFLFTGEMSFAENAPTLMMSISIEYYFSKPTFDVNYKDIDSNPVMNVNENTTSKIPVKMLVISLALTL